MEIVRSTQCYATSAKTIIRMKTINNKHPCNAPKDVQKKEKTIMNPE